MPPCGAWSGIQHLEASWGVVFDQVLLPPLTKQGLRSLKLLVSDADVSISEITVGMCFSLSRRSGGNETFQCKSTQ